MHRTGGIGHQLMQTTSTTVLRYIRQYNAVSVWSVEPDSLAPNTSSSTSCGTDEHSYLPCAMVSSSVLGG